MKKNLTQLFVILMILLISNSDVLAQTRISFARGRTSTTVAGKLAGYGKRTYVLSARNGQYLSATISSGNGCVVFEEEDSTSMGYTTAAGVNYIYIYNTCRSATSLKLTVSIK